MSYETAVISNDWFTPKYVFDAMEVIFDLDVASPKDQTFISVPCGAYVSENSLDTEWFGCVWMNPPFGNQKNKMLWIQKFIDHGNGVALMPDRTSAPWWQYFASKAASVLFVKGKIKFIRPDGSVGESPGNGTTLFAVGKKGIKTLETAEKNGLGKMYRSKLQQ